MGRLPKKGVDYFSHDIGASGRPTLYTIQERYGNDGYALWFKLLEYLGSTENLTLDSNNTPEWLYFIAYAKVQEDKAREILDMLALTGAIDKDLWLEHGVIWSDNFVVRVSEVFRRRGAEIPRKPTFSSPDEGASTIAGQENAEAAAQERQEIRTNDKTHQKTDSQEAVKTKKKAAGAKDDGKIKYADYVKMTEEQYGKLCNEYGKEAADKAVYLLDLYKGSKGKQYRDDYRAILSWVIKKVKEEFPQLICTRDVGSAATNENPFEGY